MRACLLVLVIIAGLAPDADACKCVAQTFAQHAKAEKLVVVARAGKPTKTGDALKQTFTVLATLKGKPSPTFVLDRPATPPCARDHAEGDVAILFTSGSDLDLCHGNLPLDAQLAELPAIVAATGAKRTAATLDIVEMALREALGEYLHDRPVVAVGFPALAGKSLQIAKSKLTFRAKAKRADITLAHAFSVGDVAFVGGTYGTEGVRFAMLLHRSGTWTVIGSSVAET